MPIYQDEFWGSNAKVCVTYPINANVAIIISDSQQKYVVLKAMRRSGSLSVENSKCTGAYTHVICYKSSPYWLNLTENSQSVR